jgi:1-acyl-sn-glycerol-3-phosphate acyltransferase
MTFALLPPTSPSISSHTEEMGQRSTTFAYRAVNSSLKGLVRILCRIDDAELARVPEQGPLIIILNHINFLEVPIMYTHLQPRSLTGFVKAETKNNPFLGPLLFALWGGIPIQRGEADMTALRQALQVLEDGGILAVAPEGTRSGHGCLQRGRPGIAFLASRSGAPVLPAVTYGGEFFWSNLRRLRRTDFRIVVGQPFYLDTQAARVTRHIRQQMADEIMYQMAALLPPTHRGIYSNLEAATETYLRFSPDAVSNLRHAQDRKISA